MTAAPTFVAAFVVEEVSAAVAEAITHQKRWHGHQQQRRRPHLVTVGQARSNLPVYNRHRGPLVAVGSLGQHLAALRRRRLPTTGGAADSDSSSRNNGSDTKMGSC